MLSLLTVLGIFGLSSFSFYVALNNYIIDQQHRNQLESKIRVYNHVFNNTVIAQASQNRIFQEKALLDTLTISCTNERTLIGMVSLNSAQSIADENQAALVSCNQNLDGLNRTLQQLIGSAINQTLESGQCQFNTNVSLGFTNYAYKRVTYNSVDFYYYIFDGSSNVALNSGDTNVTIQNCTPAILESGSSPVLKRGYRGSGIISAPSGGIDYLLIGNSKVVIVFATGSKTVQLNKFQIWAEGV